ncbi:adenine DNA glycosylase isoform X4 [Phyllopteryx taeniolatus]|uniref:adenine DNA glycosylase isoform X4 n=1 Tax=Phyllopteryx taeniolatus TaxID=161469 RepID=UPI002AD59A2C|nr:adenine DNA glycosylase isoform X4 [Phyllopteryx taeniolatus]
MVEGGESDVGGPWLLFTREASARRCSKGGVGARGTDARHGGRAAETTTRSGPLHCRGRRLHRAGPCQPSHARTHARTPLLMPGNDHVACRLGYGSRGRQRDPGAVSHEGHRGRLHKSCSHRGTLNYVALSGLLSFRALANTLVDPERPGDFNQAMMELGARVCTPKGPLCQQCPVRAHCHSYLKAHARQEQNSRKPSGSKDTKPPALPDIEDCSASGICPLCPSEPWDEELGVQNFPRKPAKKPPRVQRTVTCVLTRHGEEGEEEFLLMQRPNKGLLAGLWEFPSLLLEKEDHSDKKHQAALCAHLDEILGPLTENSLHYVGEVLHVFSHIRQTYVVHTLRVGGGGGGGDHARPRTANVRWVSRSALQEAAVSTAVKKIVKLCDSAGLPKERTSPYAKRQKKRQRGTKKAKASDKQLSLTSFFRTTKQEPC